MCKRCQGKGKVIRRWSVVATRQLVRELVCYPCQRWVLVWGS